MTRAIFAKTMAALVLLTTPGAAYAQRTARGGSFAELSLGIPAGRTPSRSADAAWGMYGLDFCWKACVSLSDTPYDGEAAFADPSGQAAAVPGTRVGFERIHCRAGADFLYRLASTRSRSICLYAGVGAFTGAASCVQTPRQKEEDSGAVIPRTCFLYGACPEAELEIYPLARTALVLSARLDITPGTSFQETYGGGLLQASLHAGIRVNLK